MTAREQWANMYKQWDIGQWRKVAFSDEPPFTVKPTSLPKRVGRKVGESYKTVNLVPTFKSGYESISAWGSFSVSGRTAIVRIDGNLNKDKYIEIWKQNLLPFAEKYNGGTYELIFQQDGCEPHRSKAV